MLRPSIYRNNNLGFIDNMFDDLFEDPFFSRSNQFMTSMNTDIQEGEQEYTIETELPGFQKEDVQATLNNGYLTISADHEENSDKKDKKNKYIRKERYSGHFQRSFYVGDNMTEEDIKAKYKDGILTVTIPKKEEQPKVEEKKTIAIEG